MRYATLLALLVAVAASPAAAQKGPRRYAVKNDRALVVVREVLVKRGWVVERVDEKGDVITVWYRRGNMGRGKGKGRPERLIIRRVEDRVVFEQTPTEIMGDIDVRLKL